MNIGICDDERYIAKELQEAIMNYFTEQNIPCESHLYSSGKELVDSGIHHDILFLDIDMPQMDGMSAAQTLLDQGELDNTCLVFVTSHEEEARNAFKVKAFRFLVKDSYEAELTECLDAFLLEHQDAKTHTIEFNGATLTLYERDIVFISASHNGSEIWVGDTSYSSRKTLSIWENELNSKLFIRSHKENLINISHILYIDNNAEMDNGYKAKVSRKMKKEVTQQHQQYVYNNAR